MAFMERQVHKGDGWIVELDTGSSEVLYDVNAPDVPKVGDKVWLSDDHGKVESVTHVQGWFGRYSASGYLDATPWHYAETRAELEAELDADAGEDDEDEDDLDDEDEDDDEP